jgi:CubicO group peptidase (beta-lactamase class C family)
MKLLVAAALITVLSAPAFAASPTATEENIRRVQDGVVPAVLVRGESPSMPSLAQRMTELNVPGVSIAVIHNGHLEWARGFGVARTGGPPVTADTLFQAASISKPVFALGVLHLVDAGKLKLDANVNDYLKTWKVPDNEFTGTAKVTLRGILSHSAGLTVHGFPGYAANAPVPTTVQILDGTPPANTVAVRVYAIPGTRYRYSGGGYVVAQQLLSDVTGVPLPKLMRDTVLTPLGMSRSTFEQPLPAARASEVAFPYEDGKPVVGGAHTYPEMAPAGLWTTPSDLARYALGVQAALAGKSTTVISAATARTMLTPVLENHGIGPIIGGGTALKFFTHNGGNEGYRCMLVAYQNGDGAIVMTNSDSGGQLMGEVMRTIAHVYQWPDFAPPTRTLSAVKPELLERYIGAYELNDGSTYVVRKDGDRLVGNLFGRAPVALFPSSEVELFAREVDVVVNFSLDAKGVPTAVRHRVDGYERNGPRLEETRSRQVLAAVEQTTQRIKDQKPHPGSEQAVRQLLTGLASGKPDYERMVPRFAEVTRQQLPALQQWLSDLGVLKSLTFVRVQPEGGDEFEAQFERGALLIGLGLNVDGRIEGAGLRPSSKER